jgi:hypothetical protein
MQSLQLQHKTSGVDVGVIQHDQPDVHTLCLQLKQVQGWNHATHAEQDTETSDKRIAPCTQQQQLFSACDQQATAATHLAT